MLHIIEHEKYDWDHQKGHLMSLQVKTFGTVIIDHAVLNVKHAGKGKQKAIPVKPDL